MREFVIVDKEVLDLAISRHNYYGYAFMVDEFWIVSMFFDSRVHPSDDVDTIVFCSSTMYMEDILDFMLDMVSMRRSFGRFPDCPGTYFNKLDYVLHWLRLLSSRIDNHDSIRNILDAWIYICNRQSDYDTQLYLTEFMQSLKLSPRSFIL